MRIGGLLVVLALACARRGPRAPASRPPQAIPVIETRALRMPANPARDTLPGAAGSGGTRLAMVDVARLRAELPVPSAEAAVPPAETTPPGPTAGTEALKPPIPRAPARFEWPPGFHGDPRWVELDVRVDESGAVSDALWSGGSTDSALVAAATRAALGLRYFPAQLRGRPVAVWCRQRLDLER